MQKRDHPKTNAQRAAEAAGIDARFHSLELEDGFSLSGSEVARALGEDPDRVFKTLVTRGKSGAHYVFMVPVDCELDLKKAAVSVGEKAVSMIRARELLPLTGYVHGGCSPVGMKRDFPTVIDETAQLYDSIFFSAGRVGAQMEMAPRDLARLVEGLAFADITVV